MPLYTGTLTLDEMADPLAANVALAAVGEARAAAAAQAEIDTHNRLLAEQMTPLVEITTDVQRADAGHTTRAEGSPLTETGRAPTQTVSNDYVTLGLPLGGWQYPLGHTRMALDHATVGDIAEGIRGAEAWHVERLQADMQRALYAPTNYRVRDFLSRNKINLDVKRFYNGDGWAIPLGSNGATFDALHSHYLPGPALTGALALAAINTVREHFRGANLQVWIAQADELEWTTLPGFKPYVEAGVQRGPGDRTDGTLDTQNPDNRAIGVFGGAVVWVKPFALENYAVVYRTNGPKPLACRVPAVPGGAGNAGAGGVAGRIVSSPALRLAGQIALYPLQADYMETRYGFGVNDRSACAILYTGGSTYVVPSFDAGFTFKAPN